MGLPEQAESVSIITPMRNAAAYLPEMLASIADQTYAGPLELVVYDDASVDSSVDLVLAWEARQSLKSIQIIIQDKIR